MGLRPFAIVSSLVVAAMSAGAALPGLTPRAESAPTGSIPARVTITPRGARSPLTHITMSQADVQWDTSPAVLDTTIFGGPGSMDMVDTIDAKGRHYGGWSIDCAFHAPNVEHCTGDYPPARHHAPWAIVILRVGALAGKGLVTLRVRPG